MSEFATRPDLERWASKTAAALQQYLAARTPRPDNSNPSENSSLSSGGAATPLGSGSSSAISAGFGPSSWSGNLAPAPPGSALALFRMRVDQRTARLRSLVGGSPSTPSQPRVLGSGSNLGEGSASENSSVSDLSLPPPASAAPFGFADSAGSLSLQLGGLRMLQGPLEAAASSPCGPGGAHALARSQPNLVWEGGEAEADPGASASSEFLPRSADPFAPRASPHEAASASSSSGPPSLFGDPSRGADCEGVTVSANAITTGGSSTSAVGEAEEVARAVTRVGTLVRKPGNGSKSGLPAAGWRYPTSY